MGTWLVAALVLNVLAIAETASPEGPSDARYAADAEPNDKYADAVLIPSGATIEGSLLLQPPEDLQDWYKIEVPNGHVVKATMLMLDYNYSAPAQNDFTLNLSYVYSSYGWLTYPDSSRSQTCREAVSALQLYSENTLTMYLSVSTKWTSTSNPGTTPGRYSLAVEVSEPALKGEGPVSGEIGESNSTSRADYFKLDPSPSETQTARLWLQNPPDASFSIYVNLVWPRDTGRQWLQNASWDVDPGSQKELQVGGSEGTYYVTVKARSGSGEYELESEILKYSKDDDNTPQAATSIDRSGVWSGHVDQSHDWVDWYAVRVRSGKGIDAAIDLNKDPVDYWSYFNLSAFDRDFQKIAGTQVYSLSSGPVSGTLNGVKVDYNGTLYLAVRAVPGSSSEYYPFKASRGFYNLTVVLPNEAPVLNGSLPQINMLEDTTDDTLVLSGYMYDPDGDQLQFTTVGGPYHSRPAIEQPTGRVTFSPEANWHGSELVKFRATDTGTGRPFVEAVASVVVEAVNDHPAAMLTIEDISVPEDVSTRTPDLGTVFSDVDDPFANLTFRLNVLSSETSPPDGRLPVMFDPSARAFRLGPATGFFGTFRLEVTCSDGWPGTEPARAAFNLTVSHRNHSPALREGVLDPTVVMVEEQGSLTRDLLELFTDPDLPEDYASDTLQFKVSGMLKLDAWIEEGGRLVVDTRDVEYYPGSNHEEKLLLTARDKAGRAATLNLTVVVVPLDDPPRIVDHQPGDPSSSAMEGQRTTFKVTAADNDTGELAYSWFLDGELCRGVQGNIYGFLPGHDLGGSVHTIRVEVSDGPNMVSFEWRVGVLDVNRLPGGAILNPVNMSRFQQGTEVIFTAEGWDEDGDGLTFIWRGPTGEEIGRGASIKYGKLPPGTVTVRLEINDSKGSAFQEVVLVVSKAPSPAQTPGFEVVWACLAIGAAVALIGRRRAR